jgi:hypothetical protein
MKNPNVNACWRFLKLKRYDVNFFFAPHGREKDRQTDKQKEKVYDE